MIDLNKHSKKTYSQNGEDGMIAAIFEHLGIERGTYLEMGAGDGMHISNTRLLRERGWHGVLIEGNPVDYANLASNCKGQHLINRYIDCEPDNSMDYWLSSSPLPTDFDFMSLDIDGNDLWVWDSMKQYVPKVVCIEYNYTVKESLTIAYEPAHRFNNDNYFGASAAALCKLANAKGYKLIGWTLMHNLFFIREELADGFTHYLAEQVPTGGGWPQSSRKLVSY
jgi:hypothetical protein